MPILTNCQLNSLLELENSMMEFDVEIERATSTPDGMGGFHLAWETFWSGKGSLIPDKSARETEILHKITSSTFYILDIPTNSPSIFASDRVQIDEKTYEILGEFAGFSTVKRFKLAKIE